MASAKRASSGCASAERGRVRTVNNIKNPITRSDLLQAGSGLDLTTRPEIFIGSGSVINISNLQPDNKPEKRVNIIK